MGEGVTNPRPDLEFPDIIDTVPEVQTSKSTRYGVPVYASTTELHQNMYLVSLLLTYKKKIVTIFKKYFFPAVEQEIQIIPVVWLI